MSTQGSEEKKVEEGEATKKTEAKKPKRTVADIVQSEMKRRAKSRSAEAEETAIKLDWYIVQAFSGQEQRAMDTLADRIRKNGLEDYFGEMKIPQEEVTELVKGNKKTVNKKFFPGYMLIEMSMNEDTWHLVKDTNKIVGFVGDEATPLPMSEEEVERLLEQMQEGSATLAASQQFEEGDTVKVTDGPFLDFTGTVEEVRPEKAKLRVLISIFGRATPVELEFYQVEKQL